MLQCTSASAVTKPNQEEMICVISGNVCVRQGSMAANDKSFTLMSTLFVLVSSLKEEEFAPSCQEKNRA